MKITNKNNYPIFCLIFFLVFCSCGIPKITQEHVVQKLPDNYPDNHDTFNSASIRWKDFFNDSDLIALIDTALKNNNELRATFQELLIAQNEINARKGEYLPFIVLRTGAALDKVGRFTAIGSSEATTDIEPGKATPEPLPDFLVCADASWEIDVWRKLRNAKNAAILRFFSGVEGKNFMVTKLVSEIAANYYELIALDNQLRIVNQTTELQSNALGMVRLQKESAKASELAVKRFEAQVLYTQSLKYEISQRITETQNRINLLCGRLPQPVKRNAASFDTLSMPQLRAGIPLNLLHNRPDIRAAELQLQAAGLDIKVARASFYPALRLSAGLGFQSYKPQLLITPESILYSLAGEITAPLINRNALKATFKNAGAKKNQAVYTYEQKVLEAYTEVVNNLALITNLAKTYELKSGVTNALKQSVNIAGNLFVSARVDYMEVLLTQREALEAQMQLVETRKQQMLAMLSMYKALGGGWN